MGKNKLSYLLFCIPTNFFEGRQMYILDHKKMQNFYKCITDCKRFDDLYCMNLGRDLMYDLALKHTFDDYFSEYPLDEKKVIDNILFL